MEAAACVGGASGSGFSACGGPGVLWTLCPMSARWTTGRLPNSHATVIAYGATASRFSPLLDYTWLFYYLRYGGSQYKAIKLGEPTLVAFIKIAAGVKTKACAALR